MTVVPLPVEEPCKCGKLVYALKAARECNTPEEVDASAQRLKEALSRRLVWPALVLLCSITLCLVGLLLVPILEPGSDATAVWLAVAGSIGTIFGLIWLLKLDTDRRFMLEGHALAREIVLNRETVDIQLEAEA